MISIQYTPKSILQEFVLCFYFNKSENFEYSGRANPTTRQELFFNLGDIFELKNSKGQLFNERSWISGPQTTPMSIKSSGRHITAGVIFKPWGLYTGFGINGKELANTAINSQRLGDFGNEFYHSEISESQFFDVIELKLLQSIKKN